MYVGSYILVHKPNDFKFVYVLEMIRILFLY